MPHSRTGEGDTKASREGVLRRLGEWCARHFVIVIIPWLVALVALQVVSRAAVAVGRGGGRLRRTPSASSPGRPPTSG